MHLVAVEKQPQLLLKWLETEAKLRPAEQSSFATLK